jgi:hypothetical protein
MASSKIQCELYQICHFYVSDWSFTDRIKIKIKLTARTSIFFTSAEGV